MKENFDLFLEELNIKPLAQNLLKYLREINNTYGHISYSMLNKLGEFLDLDPGYIQGVASFYHFLNVSDKSSKYRIRLCRTLSCQSENGRDKLINHIKNSLNLDFGEADEIFSLDYTSCLGLCDKGPAMMINDKIYSKITIEKFDKLIENIKNSNDNIMPETSFIMASDFLLEKEEIDIKKILESSKELLLDYVLKSNIKGRGGAGYPIGLKLKSIKEDKKNKKYIVCNGDEGEPGTFKDRYLLEEKSLLLIYGIITAMYISNSKNAYIYIRGEYKYLEDKIKESIYKAKEKLKKYEINFNFEIDLFFGLGAYICGEETALIESLEGKRGEARNRPPYPADVGYMKSATAVNNIETLCTMVKVLNRQLKNKNYEKTKLFSISGDLKNKGIYEIKLSSTIKDVLEKAQINEDKILIYGGASGTFLYPKDFHLNILDKSLPFSGSIYILNKKEDLWGVIENISEFFHGESCGQCTPCRDGLGILNRLIDEYRKGARELLPKIHNLALTIKNASKCGLGQSSCNLLLSYIESEEEENEYK